MSTIVRTASLVRGFLRAVIIFAVAGMVVEVAGLLVAAAAVFGGVDVIEDTIVAFVGGTSSGYLWGRFFGARDYEKHKEMMGTLGVDVIDN